jgi:sialate O-acetylesterase
MKRYVPLLLFFTIAFEISFCQVKLPRLIRDSMILQRDTKLRIWGWAGKNEKVSITFNNKHATTKAGADGKWFISLPPMKAGGPFTMNI